MTAFQGEAHSFWGTSGFFFEIIQHLFLKWWLGWRVQCLKTAWIIRYRVVMVIRSHVIDSIILSFIRTPIPLIWKKVWMFSHWCVWNVLFNVVFFLVCFRRQEDDRRFVVTAVSFDIPFYHSVLSFLSSFRNGFRSREEHRRNWRAPIIESEFTGREWGRILAIDLG